MAFKLIAVPCLADCPPIDEITYVFKNGWGVFQTADGWSQPMPRASLLNYLQVMYTTKHSSPSAGIREVEKLLSVGVKSDCVHCFYLAKDGSRVILEKKGKATIKHLENWHLTNMMERHYGCYVWKNLDCSFDFQ